jgi:hypothetical protein
MRNSRPFALPRRRGPQRNSCPAWRSARCVKIYGERHRLALAWLEERRAAECELGAGLLATAVQMARASPINAAAKHIRIASATRCGLRSTFGLGTGEAILSRHSEGASREGRMATAEAGGGAGADEEGHGRNRLPDFADPSGRCPRCDRVSDFNVRLTEAVSFTGEWVSSGAGNRYRDSISVLL